MLLSYLRFVELCKSHSKESLLTLLHLLCRQPPVLNERAFRLRSPNPLLREPDPVHATASGSSGLTLCNAETLELLPQLLDVKFDQKFAAFKCDLDEK